MSDTTMLIAAAQGDAKVFKTRAEAAEAERDQLKIELGCYSDSLIKTARERDRLQARVAELEKTLQATHRFMSTIGWDGWNEGTRASRRWALGTALHRITVALQRETSDERDWDRAMKESEACAPIPPEEMEPSDGGDGE